MSAGIPISLVYEGKEYTSIFALARELGINKATLHDRWQRAGYPQVITEEMTVKGYCRCGIRYRDKDDDPGFVAGTWEREHLAHAGEQGL